MATVNKPTSRLFGIQALRGLAVLMVMSVHLFEVERKYTQGPRIFDSWIHFNMVGVDIFLVISGFVLTLLAFGHFTDRAYLRNYAYARVTRVYPVYILYTLALVPVFLWQPTMFNSGEGNQVNLLRSLLLLPDVNLPLIPVAWTLHHELYFYIVFGLMLLWPQRLLPRAILLWATVSAALVVWGTLSPREDQGGFQRVLVNPINFEFILGMVAAVVVGKGKSGGGVLALVLGLVWLVVAHQWYVASHGVHWVDIYWRIPVLGIPSVLIVYGVVALERTHGWVLGRPLIWLGDAAYSVYLSHLMTMSLVGKIWTALGWQGWGPHLVFLVLTMAVALLVGKLAYEIIEKPLLLALRRWEPPRPAPMHAKAG